MRRRFDQRRWEVCENARQRTQPVCLSRQPKGGSRNQLAAGRIVESSFGLKSRSTSPGNPEGVKPSRNVREYTLGTERPHSLYLGGRQKHQHESSLFSGTRAPQGDLGADPALHHHRPAQDRRMNRRTTTFLANPALLLDYVAAFAGRARTGAPLMTTEIEVKRISFPLLASCWRSFSEPSY